MDSHCRLDRLILGSMTKAPSLQRFFLDFETTGLDPATDHVLEVGLRAQSGMHTPVWLGGALRATDAQRWPFNR